jgi:bacteriocin biosynthesis cyclodehydratase domain-containing protein
MDHAPGDGLKFHCAGREKAELALAAAQETDLEPKFLEYLLDLLANANCLHTDSGADGLPGTDNPLAEFYASVGQDPGHNLSTLAAAKTVIVTPESRREALTGVLRAAGLGVDIRAIAPGHACRAALDGIKEQIGGETGSLVAWNFPYRSPFARLLNDLALETSIPILFGTCEGLTGRIGPYVIPRNTACLECFNNRLLANGGAPERTSYEQYRARHTDTVPESWPVHPLFLDAVERLFVLELSQIVMNMPPRTIGAVLEYGFADSSLRTRPVLRVPRCEACHPARPPRIPWEVKFPAPVVKGGGE